MSEDELLIDGFYVKKCCDKLLSELESLDYWIQNGKVMVIMYEGDPELETIFE
jgi:hypothetical protein